MSAVCYFLIYVFEALISLMYFSEKFATKTKHIVIKNSYLVSNSMYSQSDGNKGGRDNHADSILDR